MGEKVILLTPPGCSAAVPRLPKPSLEYQGKPIKFITVPFGVAAPLAGGLKTALTLRGDTETTVVPWTGDGATFDIGLGLVSAAAERNEDILYVCADNEGYQNTGNQRSSATPWGATTTTSPPPSPKLEYKKDIMTIMMGHHIPYAAAATLAYPDDFMRKVQKAKGMVGFRFLHLLSPCPTGWRYPAEWTIRISRLAVETKIFPLFEIEDGIVTISKEPSGVPVEEYLRGQGRFDHLTSEEIAEFQKMVEQRWDRLQWLAGYRNDGQ